MNPFSRRVSLPDLSFADLEPEFLEKTSKFLKSPASLKSDRNHQFHCCGLVKKTHPSKDSGTPLFIKPKGGYVQICFILQLSLIYVNTNQKFITKSLITETINESSQVFNN